MENNASYIHDFIKKRMIDMGFKDFALDSVVVDVPEYPATIKLEAQNEYLYLIYPTDQIGIETLRIISDIEYFSNSDQNFIAGQPFSTREFSGEIYITCSAELNGLEFIRAIPESLL